MYALLKTGGKQFKVKKSDVVVLEKLPGNEGDTITFDEVLMIDNQGDVKLGDPTLKGAQVTGEIISQKKDKKIIVFKKKRRQNYRRKKGHRQQITIVKITDIKVA